MELYGTKPLPDSMVAHIGSCKTTGQISLFSGLIYFVSTKSLAFTFAMILKLSQPNISVVFY